LVANRWVEFHDARPSILVLLLAQPPNEFGEMRRHALIDHIIIDGSQLLADSSLHFPAEPGFGLRSDHAVPAFRLVSDRLDRLKIGVAVFHFVISPFTRDFALFPPAARSPTHPD
jgi:hypothetical protein